MAAHLFAEEVNRVGLGWRKFGHQIKGDELYFQDLPIYIKLISLQQLATQRWGKKPPPTKTRKRNKQGINSQAGEVGGGGKC